MPITDETKVKQELYPYKKGLPKNWIAAGAVVVVVGAAIACFLVLGKGGDAAHKNGPGFGLNLLKEQKKEEPDSAVLTVAVAPVTTTLLDRKLPITGTIWAWDPLSIGSEVGGLRIESIQVDEGDSVKRGQILASLNSAVLKAALEREKAKVLRCRANLVKAKQPNRPQDIAGLKAARAATMAQISQEEANVVRAKANLANAQSNAERYKLLSRDGAVSIQEVEAKETAEKTAAAELQNAEKRLEAAKFMDNQSHERLKMATEGGRQEDILIAEADLKETSAAVQQIEAQIRQTVITAPDDGLITKRNAHIGDISAANQPLFEMVRNSRFEVRSHVPEHDLALVKANQMVEFEPMSGSVPPFSGFVREVMPTVDRSTRLATVRIDIPFHKELRPGMFVHGKAHAGKEPVLTVPATAVVDRDGRSTVFVFQNNAVYARSVSVGERTSEVAEIRSGLKEREEVVSSGAGFLKDGDKVRLGSIGTAEGK